MRLHNWEKWSDSDLLIWTASPENNAKIKPNIGPHSSYLHEATTHTHTQNWIISVAETWLLTLAMLSLLLCANKVIRIELGAADAQEELRKMLSRWNQWLSELIPCQRLQQLLGGIHHSGQQSSTAEAARQVSGGDSQGAEDQQVSEEGKGGPSPLPRARQAENRAENNETLRDSQSSPGCGKGRGGREGGWERT